MNIRKINLEKTFNLKTYFLTFFDVRKKILKCDKQKTLSHLEINSIIDRKEKGEKNASIAREFQIHPKTVARIYENRKNEIINL